MRILVLILAVFFFFSAYWVNPNNSILRRKREFKRLNVGDKVCLTFPSAKAMLKYQGYHKICGIITAKITAPKLSDCYFIVAYYVDDVFQSSDIYGIYKKNPAFFTNWHRIDDYCGVQFWWMKHYKGKPWY